MLKLKIKSNFKLFIIIAFSNYLIAQGMFIHSDLKNTYSFSMNYLKHDNLDDYNYGIKISSLLKGKLQFDALYEKKNYYNISDKIWEEYLSFKIGYFIKKHPFIKYSINTSYNEAKKDNSKSNTSFSLKLFTERSGPSGTGMTYFPYLEFKRIYFADYNKIFKDMSELEELGLYDDFYQIGCSITFNDLWIKPFYRKQKSNNSLYSGIEIGFWDYNKKNN